MREKFEANTAKNYITVGLVFYLIPAFGAFAALIGVSWAFWSAIPWITWRNTAGAPAIALLLIGLGVLVNIGLTYWAWTTYKKIDEGNYEAARTSSLVLGILGLLPFLGSFIGGIFFLLAYAKLGDVLRWAAYPATPVAFPSGPASTRFCVSCGRNVDAHNLFCAHCGAQLPE